MEREIKFRVYFDNKFYYFTLNQIMERSITYQGSWDLKALKAEKQQYIGLNDMNNKPIYEGDYVKVFDVATGINSKGYVTFRDGSFCITDGCFTRYRWTDYQIEIIGNDDENPELYELIMY